MRLFLLLFLFALASTSVAQNQPMNQTTRDWMNLSNGQLSQGTVSMPSFDQYRKQLLGSPFEDSTFQAGTIRFYGKIPGMRIDSLVGVPMRHDLLTQNLEILAGPNNIRLAQAQQVRQFTVSSSYLKAATYYLNVREFRGEADQLLGFFEVLAAGRATLLRYPATRISKSNYNVAMNVGNKDDALVLTQAWYAAVGRKAVAFTANRRGILALLADKGTEVEAYLKQQKPDLKSRAGLIAVFTYYNSL